MEPFATNSATRKAVYPGILSEQAPGKEPLSELLHVLSSGYRFAMRLDSTNLIWSNICALNPEHQGVAFEGAAMGCAALDSRRPVSTKRFSELLKQASSPLFISIAHVGLGMALARTGQALGPVVVAAHPVLRWSVVSGYGFYQGFFNWQSTIAAPADLADSIFEGIPSNLIQMARQIYDQGMGRSLWFLYAADVRSIAESANRFPQPRRQALWTGIGIASTYAGGAAKTELLLLKNLAAEFVPFLAQGAAIAARIRSRDANVCSHTADACKVFWEAEPQEVAEIAEAAWQSLAGTDPEMFYANWLDELRKRFAGARG